MQARLLVKILLQSNPKIDVDRLCRYRYIKSSPYIYNPPCRHIDDIKASPRCVTSLTRSRSKIRVETARWVRSLPTGPTPLFIFAEDSLSAERSHSSCDDNARLFIRWTVTGAESVFCVWELLCNVVYTIMQQFSTLSFMAVACSTFASFRRNFSLMAK